MDFNKMMESVIREHIKNLSEERQSLEENKSFRRVPYDVKEPYYKSYDNLMGTLYDILFDLNRGGNISFDEYNDLISSSDALSEYLIKILKSYGIKYRM
ncbi:MAG: hypothetical protein II309_01625 [Bacilli bacterium]|nr:hypothetical protein [Bacilli bacterium]